MLNTAHKAFTDPDSALWHEADVEAALDGRNLWDQYEVEASGILYFGIGRSALTELR